MKWVHSGEYDRIIRGEYRKRTDDVNVRAEASDAMEYYAERFRAAFRELGENVTNLGSQVGDVSQQVADWLRNRGGGGGSGVLRVGRVGPRQRRVAGPSRAAGHGANVNGGLSRADGAGTWVSRQTSDLSGGTWLCRGSMWAGISRQSRTRQPSLATFPGRSDAATHPSPVKAVSAGAPPPAWSPTAPPSSRRDPSRRPPRPRDLGEAAIGPLTNDCYRYIVTYRRYTDDSQRTKT